VDARQGISGMTESRTRVQGLFGAPKGMPYVFEAVEDGEW